MLAPCALDFIGTSNNNGTDMARASCCYATQPLKADGLPSAASILKEGVAKDLRSDNGAGYGNKHPKSKP